MQFRSTCAMHADKKWAYSFEQWLPWVQGDNDTTCCRSRATSHRFKRHCLLCMQIHHWRRHALSDLPSTSALLSGSLAYRLHVALWRSLELLQRHGIVPCLSPKPISSPMYPPQLNPWSGCTGNYFLQHPQKPCCGEGHNDNDYVNRKVAQCVKYIHIHTYTKGNVYVSYRVHISQGDIFLNCLLHWRKQPQGGLKFWALPWAVSEAATPT